MGTAVIRFQVGGYVFLENWPGEVRSVGVLSALLRLLLPGVSPLRDQPCPFLRLTAGLIRRHRAIYPDVCATRRRSSPAHPVLKDEYPPSLRRDLAAEPG